MNNQDVKLLIIFAMGRPSRKSRAKALERAFVANILVTKKIRERLPESDQKFIDLMMDDSPSRDDATPEIAQTIESDYPELAEALTNGAAILEIIELKKYWRELGFSSYGQFDATIEEEHWLVVKVNEFQSANN